VEKLSREVLIGNVPAEISERNLLAFLNDAMERARLCSSNYKPFVRCRLANKQAFVECATTDDATKVLGLNGICFHGSYLRMSYGSRRLHFRAPTTRLRECKRESQRNRYGSLMPSPSSEAILREGTTTCPPSNVLKLKNMIHIDDLESDEDYEDLMREIKEECNRFGTLGRVMIPRSGINTCTVFLEYRSVAEAANAIKAIRGKMFEGEIIEVDYFDGNLNEIMLQYEQ